MSTRTVEGLFLPEGFEARPAGFRDAAARSCSTPKVPTSRRLFSGDTIDVGALAEEFFGLAIDPYPRKPGAAAADGVRRSRPLAEPDGPLQEKLRQLTRKS